MREFQDEVVADRQQYLTFFSAGQNYAISIMRMREIVPYTGSTKMPLAPRMIRGLINLRGRAIPVVDLSMRFANSATTVTKRTCVLIVDLEEDAERSDLGILADSVNRVVDIDPSELEDTPTFGMSASSEYLEGMLKTGDEFIPIIDVEEVLRSDGPISDSWNEDSSAELPSSEPTPAAMENAASSTQQTEKNHG